MPIAGEPAVQKSAQSLADKALMQGVSSSESTALEALMKRYWSRLVTYASTLTENEDAAEDVVQDTFVRVWQHRERWVPSGTVGAYLYRITRNLAINARRDLQAQRIREERGGTELKGSLTVANPEQDTEAAELRREILAAIAELPVRRREVFMLSRFHGMSYDEIADAMELSPRTVANHMSAALADLRSLLRHHLASDPR